MARLSLIIILHGCCLHSSSQFTNSDPLGVAIVYFFRISSLVES